MATYRYRPGGARPHQFIIRRKGFKPQAQSFEKKSVGERWARDIESKMDRGVEIAVADLRKTTVRDLIARYVKEVVPERRGRRWEEVRAGYLLAQDFVHRRLDQDVAGALRAWVLKREGEVSAATVVRDMAFLSTIFSHAIKRWGVPLPANPLSLVARPDYRPVSKGQVWTEDALAKLREAAKGRTGVAALVVPALELSIETAMRRGEICSFLAGDVHLDERRIWLPATITKTGTGRNALLSTRAVEILTPLLAGLEPGDRVFAVNPDSLGVEFRDLRNKAGLGSLRYHDSRHTATTRAAERFDNVLELATFTGHRSLGMLQRYYHASPTDLAAKLG